MKALFAAITLLTAVAASAQTSPSFAPPPGQATGSAPPAASAGFRGDDDDDDDKEFRRGRRGTLVVVEREDVEKRLADLEELLGEAFKKRGSRSKAALRDAYEELKDIRELISEAQDVRDYRRGRGGNHNPGPIPPPAPVYQPIAAGKLQKLMGTMSREPFADDKLSVLEDAAGTQYFLVGQVQQVLNQFQFSQDRLKAVRFLWSRVLDRDNGFQLYNSFQFSQDKAELKRILAN